MPEKMSCSASYETKPEPAGSAAAKAAALGAAFKGADPSETGFVSYDVLQDILAENDMELNDQVLITLMRRYDYNKDGNIKWVDFMSLAA